MLHFIINERGEGKMGERDGDREGKRDRREEKRKKKRMGEAPPLSASSDFLPPVKYILLKLPQFPK